VHRLRWCWIAAFFLVVSAGPLAAEETPTAALSTDRLCENFHLIAASERAPGFGDAGLAGIAAPETATPGVACDEFHLIPVRDRAAWPEASALAAAASPGPPGTETPDAEPELGRKQPSKLLTFGILAGVAAGSAVSAVVLENPNRSFHITQEGWFGKSTYAGGADKASHYVDFYIISKEMSFLYNTLGYSRAESIGIGLGFSLLVGLINESGDGFTKYGFSYEDLTMDVAGGLTAAIVSALGANDLIGFREGFLLPSYNVPACCPSNSVGQAYQNQLYTADLKLAGLARRLNLNIGPLRYLLLSATYATKGYATGSQALEERQIGFEIGLNLEEALLDIGVRRDTWWGYTLHVVLDNVRIPFTSVGFQYDLNGKRWRGPGNGNSYSTR
jgi:uncharacterized protein YfiM (DUF2279 family)